LGKTVGESWKRSTNAFNENLPNRRPAACASKLND
jgi:hypothetical protein